MKNFFLNMFGSLLYGWFLRLGRLFYNKIAIRGDATAAHFASSEWAMVKSMEEYMDDEDYIQQKENENDD